MAKTKSRRSRMTRRQGRARKYVSKRRAVRRAKNNNLVRKIKQVVSSLNETKQAYYNTGDTLTMFNSGINAVGDIMQIVPNIANGTEDNQRIGQQIRTKNLNIRGFIKLNVNDVSDSTRLPSVAVRLMVVSMKTAPNYTEAQSQSPKLGTLLKKGGTTTTFSGLLSDLYAPVNTDAFTLHYNKVYYLNQSYLNAQGVSPPSVYVAQDVSKTVKFFNINVRCKNRLLKYDEDVSSDLLPTNFAPFLVLGYTYLDGSSTGIGIDTVSTNVGLQYISTMSYEDA